MQVSPKTASVQSVASVPNPATHRQRNENVTHARQPTMLKLPKAFFHSSPRDRTDGERLQTASKIHLAAGLERPPANFWCQILQLRSCSAKPGTNVKNMCLHGVHQFAFSVTVRNSHRQEAGLNTGRADRSIIGTGPRSTAFEAAKAFSIMTMTYLQCT